MPLMGYKDFVGLFKKKWYIFILIWAAQLILIIALALGFMALFASCTQSPFDNITGQFFGGENSTSGSGSGSGGSVSSDCINGLNKAANKYVSKVNEAAAKYNTDPALMMAQLQQESGFNPNATSYAGAQGIAQFMPSTWQGVAAKYNIDGNNNGTENAYEAEDGIYAQAAYNNELAKELEKYNLNTTENIIAAYNAGPGAVEKYHGIPPFSETQNYVRNIMANYQKYKKCLQSSSNSSNNPNSSKEVICINEDKKGDCGYASAAMIINYYTQKTYTTTKLKEKYPNYHWFSGMTSEVGNKHIFKEGNYLSSGFSDINNALEKGYPVLISGQFPPNGGQEHFMVITRYNKDTKKYIINNPNINSCYKDIEVSAEFFTNNPYPSGRDTPAGWYTY